MEPAEKAAVSTEGQRRRFRWQGAYLLLPVVKQVLGT